MTYEDIYSRFLSRIKDRKLINLSDEDFNEIMQDYLQNALGNPQVRKIFNNIDANDEEETITYELADSIDESSDERFVLDVLTQALVLEWMQQKIDTDTTLAYVIGGKEEKVLKNDLKPNIARLNSLESKLQRTIRNHGYYNGSYSTEG